MVDRRTRIVIDEQLEQLRRCILCLTSKPIQIFYRPDNPKIVTFEFVPKNDPASLKLKSRLMRAYFGMRLEFLLENANRVPPGSKLVLSGYSFQILNGSKKELMAYHWHPHGLSRVRAPHLHIGTSVDAEDTIAIGDLHLPTGTVSLAAIVRFLIEEIGVEPNRSDWNTILSQIEAEG